MDTASLEGKNVVLVVVDTLRADHLELGGYKKPNTPFINRLAHGGVLFQNAYSGASWTAPAMASMFTSIYPDHHGVTTGLNFQYKAESLLEADDCEHESISINRIPEGLPTLPEVMRAAGYRTFGVADNPNIGQEIGFTRGFDHFSGGSYRGAPAVNEDVLGFADELRKDDDPFFLYVHYMDPHKPYHKQERGYVEKGTAAPKAYFEDAMLYDSEINYVDRHMRELFSKLGLGRDTIVIFTADHGEELGDHGRGGHSVQLYEELIHVPFLITGWDKQGEPLFAQAKVEQPVSTLDILPSLRELLNLPHSELDQGLSLAPFAMLGTAGGRPELGPARVLFSNRKDEREGYQSEQNVAIQGRLKLYDRGNGKAVTLADLDLDRLERVDQSGHRPLLFRELKTALQEHLVRPRSINREFGDDMELSPSQIEELGRLGYTDPVAMLDPNQMAPK